MMNLSDIFGTARFGQQSLQQGRDITSALATGFVRRINREEQEEAEKRNLIGGIASLIGAGIGATVGGGMEGGDSVLGATIGSEIGKSLIGKADVSNIINVALKQQELGQKKEVEGAKLLQKQQEMLVGIQEEDAKELIDFQQKGFRVMDASEAAIADPSVKPFVVTLPSNRQVILVKEKETADAKSVGALSKGDLVKQNLEEVPVGTTGGQEVFVIDTKDPSGYRKTYVKERGVGAEYTATQVEEIDDVEDLLTKNAELKDFRASHRDIGVLREALLKNDPTLVGALQSRIARALAGEKGVLTDRDVKRVAGSQQVWDRMRRVYNKFQSGKMNEEDVLAFASYIDTIENNLVSNNNEFIDNLFERRAKRTDMTVAKFNEIFKDDFKLQKMKIDENKDKDKYKGKGKPTFKQAERILEIYKKNPNSPEGIKAKRILIQYGYGRGLFN